MQTTPNLGLKKPETNEYINISDFNYNADIIDSSFITKVDATGGDISETVIESLDTIATEFPVPNAGESTGTFLGKVKKFITDFNAFRVGIITLGKLVNNGQTTEPGFALDARYGKTLADELAQLNANLKDMMIINTVSLDSPSTINPNVANHIDIPFSTPNGYKAISAYHRSTGNSLVFAVQCEIKNNNTVTINLGNLSGSAREAKPFVNVVFVRNL